MAQLSDLPRPDTPTLDLLEDPFYATDVTSLMACLDPLPLPDEPVSPKNPPLSNFQVSQCSMRPCMTVTKDGCVLHLRVAQVAGEEFALTFYASRGLMTLVKAACLDSASINSSRLLLAHPAECHCTAWHAAAWNL